MRSECFPFCLYLAAQSPFSLSNSGGVMHPYTPLEPLFLHRVIKSTSSTILDMSIAHILTAQKMRRRG